MVNKCCVPNCKGNYRAGPKVSTFQFPKDDELKQQWIICIKREKGFKPSIYHRVCELHFKPDDIIREEVLFDRKKNINYTNKLTRPLLKDGALPLVVILPNGSKYVRNRVTRGKLQERSYERISKNRIQPAKKEKIPKTDRSKAEEDSGKKIASNLEVVKAEKLNTVDNNCNKYISFLNFQRFKDSVKNNESVFNEDNNWSILYKEREVIFMNFELHPVPKIRCSAIVNENVSIRVFNDVTELKQISSIHFPVTVGNILHLDLILKKLLQLCDETKFIRVL